MTDESQTPEQPAEESAPAADEGLGGDFTSGEGLVALAGMLFLAIWILFDVFLDEFGLALTTLLLAATVVIVPRLDRDTVEKVAPLPVIMKVTGYGLVVIGVISIVWHLETGFFDDALPIIGALASYAGYAMAFFGARSIEI